MSTRKDGGVLRELRTLFVLGTPRDLTDGQLLERFATAPREAAEQAFSTLIERHGPLVLRVCRGVLNDPQDAQDAFQATFLVLVKRARGLWVRDSLGPWLYQVAYRTASCARRTAARRRRLERLAAIPIEVVRTELPDDLNLALHEEIHRLPERFRAPIVLCDLEGLTHELAARHLGWPVGTVKSRLTRGRDRLRDRLVRRGITPNAGLIAVSLRPDTLPPLISPSLLDATTKAAIQFTGFRAILVGSAATLAQEVLRSMILTGSLKIATVVLAVGATTVSGVSLMTPGAGPGRGIEAPSGVLLAQAPPEKIEPKPSPSTPTASPNAGEDGKTYTIKPGKFSQAVVERGNLESARHNSLVSQIEGQTIIISLLPEGTRVKKGDLICQLDSATLKDRLINQKIMEQEKDAAYHNAKLAREMAEIAVTEYLEGTYQIKLTELKREEVSARSTLKQSEDRLQRLRVAQQRVKEILGKLPEADVKPADIVAGLDIEDRLGAAEGSIMADKFTLEATRVKLDVLEKYTKPKKIKDLTSEVEKARSDELARKQTWELEKAKAVKLEKQITYCRIHAPSDGTLVYPRSEGTDRRQIIEEGASVRERQLICSVIDLDGPMQINTKITEPLVGRIQGGQKARIRIDAFPNQVLTGEVNDVAPLADAASFRTVSKRYTAHVKIDETSRSLRPGMTAEVEIITDELDNVISVPTKAVINRRVFGRGRGENEVAVKKPDGTIEWRAVSLGGSNAERVEIKEGLREGETVLLDPPQNRGGLQ